MTPEDFIAWRKSLDLNRVEAANLLGAHRNSVTNYEQGTYPVPPYIALACAALSAGIPPWAESNAALYEAVRKRLDKKAAA